MLIEGLYKKKRLTNTNKKYFQLFWLYTDIIELRHYILVEDKLRVTTRVLCCIPVSKLTMFAHNKS